MLQVVWFKRDLRVQDHAALYHAAQRGSVLPLYVIEPDYWQGSDSSLRQWLFIRDALLDLNQQLMQRSANALPHALCVFEGSVTEALQQIAEQYGDFELHSHEETGNYWTFQRDMTVKSWCRTQGIRWQEYRQFGVFRADNQRDHWAKRWAAFIEQDGLAAPLSLSLAAMNSSDTRWLSLAHLPTQLGLNQSPCPNRQIGGEQQAHAVFQDFLDERGRFYRGSISSPLTAERACSRISPYLAWGCISMRTLVMQSRDQLAQTDDTYWKNSLRAFESRLWWHCHFIQKLEDQPDMEFRVLHPAYQHLRTDFNETAFQAWKTGHTGWPLVDACMRFLQQHGWLNFRMRAMLMSIASYPLWLHWQQPAWHLAQLFVDYEPGIHYPQVQMQAGTTGMNIPRMYNPTLQAQKQDPHGVFIRRWVPELTQVSDQWIHQPWLMTPLVQARCGVVIDRDYPAPLVDYTDACRRARQAIKTIRDGEFFETSQQLVKKHGSRKPSSSQRKKRRARGNSADKNTQQMNLF